MEELVLMLEFGVLTRCACITAFLSSIVSKEISCTVSIKLSRFAAKYFDQVCNYIDLEWLIFCAI